MDTDLHAPAARTDAEAHPAAGGPPGASGLQLDARQRAMLEEMGVRVWWPGPVPDTTAPAAEAAVPRPAPRTGLAPGERTLPQPQPQPHSQPHPGSAAPVAPSATATPAAPSATATPAAPLRHPAALPLATRQPPSAHPPAADTALAPGGWRLQPPQALFPHADPQRTPAALGAGWLVVVEGHAGTDPLAGDAGRLLENMLRALQLHHHPRAFVCLLDAPPASEAPAPGGLQALEAAVAAVQPAVLLLLGRTAARVLLGRSEPLGQLRTATLQVAGVPAVVGYDTPYLLRAQPAKAQAWADLCRARALAGGGSSSTAAAGSATADAS